jgi:excisionase family DNA binding protein
MATHFPLSDDDPVLVSEAGRRLGVSAATIRKWIASGRLHAKRTVTGTRILSGREIEELRASINPPQDTVAPPPAA